MARDQDSDLGTCLDARQIEGRYANHFSVGHNAFEFVLEFGQFFLDGGRERVHTRIIISPSYLKAFVETLRDSIAQYEDMFGPLSEDRTRFGGPGCGGDQ